MQDDRMTWMLFSASRPCFFFFSSFSCCSCKASDQPSWELPWWLVCWWHLMPKKPLGSLGLQWIFLVHPKKCLVSIPKIAKIEVFWPAFWWFFLQVSITKKHKHAKNCIHMDLSCKNSNLVDGTLLDENPKPRYFREHTAIAMGLVAALLIGIVGLSRHENFQTKFSKRWRTQHSHHTTLEIQKAVVGDEMMVKEPIRMITVLQGEFHGNTETLNFPAEKEGICLRKKLGNLHPKSDAFTNRQVSYQGGDTIPVGIPRCSELRKCCCHFYCPLPPDPPDHSWPLGWGWVLWHFSTDSLLRICITTTWILSAIHLAKWHAPTKKIDVRPGSFLVREAARAEGLCCRDASTLDKLQYSAFDGRKIGRGSPWS